MGSIYTQMVIGFLFPGQGSQHVGMGKSLIEGYPEAKQLYNQADEILGFSIRRLILEGQEDATLPGVRARVFKTGDGSIDGRRGGSGPGTVGNGTTSARTSSLPSAVT